jgi:ABC-type transport system involved in multi-copper enzyme maturation permease subunit
MFLGAVCEREVLVAPRARGLYVARAVYAGTLLGIIATCWLLVTGTQAIATVGDAARFGGTLMRILGPLQLALAMLSAALASVVAVGVEKDRKTMELLLVSRLGDAQLVLGKLSGSLLRTGLLLLAAVPIFTLATVFGGITPVQIVRMFVVTAAAAAAAASIANAVAFWRDTTFQALAITAFLLVAWLAAGEAAAVAWGQEVAAMVSPARALFSSVSPTGGSTLPSFLGCCAGLVAVATGWAITRARAWNTVVHLRPRAEGETGSATARQASRPVWSNPVLWRELQTRAHGRAMIVVRVAWLLLFVAAVAAVVAQARSPRPDRAAVAIAVVPMVVASLLAITALAVTSVTTERDRGTFDLLLVSDLEPKEFVWGKLLGVLGSAAEMVALPLVLCLALVPLGLATPEHGGYLALGLAVLIFFVAVLGVYAGLSHTTSRRAIAVALGIVAFLFVGVATAMRIMVAFGGSFELQLAPFLAAIVGGAIGLYAALSARNPSPAVGWTSALLPALTFVAITGFLQGSSLQVFLVVVAAYGFGTLALLVPSIAAFDLLTGRTTTGE